MLQQLHLEPVVDCAAACLRRLACACRTAAAWAASLAATQVISVARGFGWRFNCCEPQRLRSPNRVIDCHQVLHVVIDGAVNYRAEWMRGLSLASSLQYLRMSIGQ